jgi:hypothetical protein
VDQYTLDAPFDIAEANLPGVRSSAVTYTHPLTLPAGEYTVETAVVDLEGNRASSSVIRVPMPEPRAGVDLSSIVLVQRVEPVSGEPVATDPLVYQGKRVVPLVAGALNADTKPYAYFVVYPDHTSTEKPKIQVEFLMGGKVLARQVAELPAPDASGAIPMMVSAAVRPGDCELRITAQQGSNSAMNSVLYTVRAK